ncbi:hypothetical protein NQ315_015035 [Exocentrus adspersus]|uniref:Ig-like domain-containing protein n=1 Tax=Exocentrus adspersus TaxID=1586481 RepID=A0AAV8VWY2_9CUCU|nr:hypothetical protein NQ315_015035 [Exocentrus adspersus]
MYFREFLSSRSYQDITSMELSKFYVALGTLLCIVLRVLATPFADTSSPDDDYILNNFENVTAVTNTTLLLQCPKKTDNTQWRLLNDANSVKGKLLKADSDMFEFRPVTPQDEGIYACFANETSIIKRYNLTVFEPPHFTKKMQKLIVKPAGNMVRLNCKAGGIPPPNITWYRDDKSPPKRELGDIKTNHWSLVLEDSVPNDKGNYTCVVCNVVGCINFTFVVDVVGVKDEPTNFFTIGIVAAIGAVIVFSVITFMCIHFRQKIKREKREKMIAVETARAAIKTTQWTKKVIIEKMTNASENVSEPLVC